MKNLISPLIALFLILIVSGSSFEKKNSDTPAQLNINNKYTAGKKISQIIAEKKNVNDFSKERIFDFDKVTTESDNSSSFVTKASMLNLRKESVAKLLIEKKKNILFSIPLSDNSSIELELTQSFPVSPDLVIKNKSGTNSQTTDYSPGLHYQGIIKGKESSLASISIFENFVMGLISDETGNYVLGAVKNSDKTYSDNYIFYNDIDLIAENNFKCALEDNEEKFIKPVKEITDGLNHNGQNDNPARLPVKVYFEADYQMYVDADGDVDVLISFITGMFNQVAALYQNDLIPVEISGIGYWPEQDPYSFYGDSYQILELFGEDNKDEFSGNIAHLISTRTDGLGGIAWIRVLCYEYNPNDFSGRFAFSNIETGYNPYPTYSWTVNVVAHEMGHNLGSRHTHSCVWPIGGNIRAIDSCYYSEGGCFSDNQIRPRVGTIMSYCHLWPTNQGGGVNLASGFGQLPGDTIRLRYAQASCLDQLFNSSEAPSTFNLKQNFPNPFNPSTTITFALPVDAIVSLKIYDVSGKLIADVIQNRSYAVGFHNYSFNSQLYGMSSGIYFYTLEADGKLVDTKRMVLIK